MDPRKKVKIQRTTYGEYNNQVILFKFITIFSVSIYFTEKL